MVHPEAGDDLGKQRSEVYASEPFFRSCGFSRTAIPACPLAPGGNQAPNLSLNSANQCQRLADAIPSLTGRNCQR
jgi:hypothetical protein